MKKFELVADSKITVLGIDLFRTKALVSFGNVTAGEIGGYVQKEENISQEGDAWVYGDARVSGNAWVYGDARVSGNAWVSLCSDVMWISNIGSENGTLTICKASAGLFVSRGCFSGALDEFEIAVEKRHGDSDIGKQYKLLIQFAKMKFGA